MYNSLSLLSEMYVFRCKQIFVFLVFVFTLAVGMVQMTVAMAAINPSGTTVIAPITSNTDDEFINHGTIDLKSDDPTYGVTAPALGPTTTNNDKKSYTIRNSITGNITLDSIVHNITIGQTRTFSHAMSATSNAVASHALTNDGEISFKDLYGGATSEITSYGMYSETNGINYLENTGTISMELTQGNLPHAHGFVGMFAKTHAPNSPAGEVTLLNSGNITTKEGFNSELAIVGMWGQGASSLEIENSGKINLFNAGAGNIYGMQATELVAGGSGHILQNIIGGEIKIESEALHSYIYGMYAKGEGNHSLFNEGSIDMSGKSYAYGLSATGLGNHTLVNDGEMTISSEADEIYALYAQTSGAGEHTLTNNEKITLTGGQSVKVTALYAEGNGNHKLENAGEIVIKSGTGGVELVRALYAEGEGAHYLKSTGTISIDVENSTGVKVFGLYAFGNGSHTLLNENSISITNAQNDVRGLHADTASLAGVGSHYIKNLGVITIKGLSELYGISAEGDFDSAVRAGHKIENLSDINIVATHGAAYGIAVDGKGAHDISNSAKIYVEGTSNIYGIYIGSNASGTTVSNTGEITAKNTPGGYSYEVYGEADYNVKNWSTVLRVARTGASDYVFGAANGKKIHFDGGTIIARAGEDFENGKVYDVRDMIDSNVQDDDISGGFGNVATEVDLLRAVLIGTDAKTQQIRLVTSIDEKTNPVGQLATFTVNNTIARMQGLGAALFKQTIGFTGAHAEYTKDVLERQQAEQLAEAEGFEAEEGGVYGVSAGSEEAAASAARLKNWRTFISPYGAYATHSKYNGTGTSGGILGGLTYTFNDVFALGFHFDLNIASNELDAFEMTTDTFSGAFGLHGTVLFTPDWYARAQATVSFGSNDSTFSLAEGTGLSDDVNYGDFALFAGLHTGYVFKINDNHTLTPEIGLTFLTMSIDDMSLRFKGAVDYTGIYDIDFEEINYSALYGNFNLRYAGKFLLSEGADDEANSAGQSGEGFEVVKDKLAEEADKLYLSPSLAFGIRQNLTGTEMNSKLRFIGNSYTTKSYEDSTTFTANVGIEIFNRTFSFGLAYDGEYGYYRKSHGGSALFKFNF